MYERVLAVVLDGKVVRVQRFDAELSAALLSGAEIVDVTDISITESWSYDPVDGFYADIDGVQKNVKP